MDIEKNWPKVRALFKKSFLTSWHYAIASVNAAEEPHVTPIGALILGKPGHGFYFEEFTTQLPKNVETNKHICVMAVNSSRWFWTKSVLQGRLASPPAVRLHGTVGASREATEEEIELWQSRVKPMRFSKGHAMLWANMKTVRDITFSKLEPVQIGAMTRDLWD